INGVYDVQKLQKSYRGIVDKTHFMIPAANWLATQITADGETLDLGKRAFHSFQRVLDLREGTLTRSFVWQTAGGKKLKIAFLRFLDRTNRERAYQRITLEALDADIELQLTASLSFDAIHEGTGSCPWLLPRLEAAQGILLAQCETARSNQSVFAGALLTLPGETETCMESRGVSLRAKLTLAGGQSATIDRRAVILYDGTEGETLWSHGLKALEQSRVVTLDEALTAQRAWWAAFWRTSDISIEPMGDETAEAVAAEQQGVRFCSFQLAQTYNGGSMRHNIGAKGLTGEAYNGHAFWDTEACCLPFYLFTNPKAAKALLQFRYNTLPQARERAKMLDCKGACYPIATLNGEEACSLWQHASLQLQPSTAVAYGIWHYVHVTGDEEFLWEPGAEMLLEIARFLMSRVEKGGQTGKYGFFGVMGPDEFHMMVNNNAYTNYMGKRTLALASETLSKMRAARPQAYAALKEKTALSEEEVQGWAKVAEEMFIPIGENGLIEQHDGFFNLPHTDIHSIPVSQFPLYDHWSYDRIYRSDMIKQPDVLMMLYLYDSSFSEAVKRVNYEFYEPRTIHESSLSPAIHSILAAELHKMEEAVRFFGFATRLDLDNYNRNTREGLHITSIALAWVNIVYGFAGLRSDGEGLSFAPRLPKRWKSLAFSILYRGRVICVRMEKEKTAFLLTQGEDLSVRIYGREYTLERDACFVPAED
ncbi:MAG: family 65 glycosyl hydrolase, partial [Clostridia bacterium]|nr:family 65 glycosyl hydrolase [Clostridia bacterium]